MRVALAGTAGNDGWLVTSPIALITASDNAAAPIAELELAVGDGAWVTVGTNVNTAVQAVTGEGIVSVRARATDAAGNVSEIAAAEARVDATAPTVTASVDTASPHYDIDRLRWCWIRCENGGIPGWKRRMAAI